MLELKQRLPNSVIIEVYQSLTYSSSVPLLCCVGIHILVSKCGGISALVAYSHKGCWEICFKYWNIYFHNSRRWEGPFIFNSCYKFVTLVLKEILMIIISTHRWQRFTEAKNFLPAIHSVPNNQGENFLGIEQVLFLPPHVVCALCFCFLEGRVARFSKYKHMQHLGPTYMG